VIRRLTEVLGREAGEGEVLNALAVTMSPKNIKWIESRLSPMTFLNYCPKESKEVKDTEIEVDTEKVVMERL
jgi:hypothetical protein